MKKEAAYRGVTRLLVPNFDGEEGRALTTKMLPEDVQRHLKVLRMADGEEIEILDGEGHRYAYLFSRKEPWIRRESYFVSRYTQKISLYLSPPKGDDFHECIAQATEMGVEAIHFLRTQHNQYPLKSEPWIRAERISRAAQEQCGLPWSVSMVPGWQTLEAALSAVGEAVFCDESSAPGRRGAGWIGPEARSLQMGLFIGPEGGWSVSEVTLMRARARSLSLGPLILRVPTAIVSAVTYLRTRS